MENEAYLSILEFMKMNKGDIEKLSARVNVIENDYQERFYRRRFLKILLAFYPIALVVLLFMIGADHQKLTEIGDDVSELIHDSQSLMMSNNDQEYDNS